MIDIRLHSIVVYDEEHNEIFSLAIPINGCSMMDLHVPDPFAMYNRSELREIAEAIIIFTDASIWSES